MITDEPEYGSDEDGSLQDEAGADDKGEEAEKLHPTSIAATEAVTAARFHARHRNELQRRGVVPTQLPRLTKDGETPPCFKLADVSYDEWLASASLLGATVPYRYDMPGEPNYCWDCTADFKCRAKKAGVCQFPGTRFERVQTVIRDEHKKVVEVEVVGISRRRHIQFEGSLVEEMIG